MIQDVIPMSTTSVFKDSNNYSRTTIKSFFYKAKIIIFIVKIVAVSF